jgi:hypothetical protein
MRLSLARASRAASWSAVAAALAVAPAAAQTDYYNTDAGRPVRVEDASVIERYAFDLEPFPVAMQRTSSNFYRYKIEPHIGYGILPMTQLELGAPLVVVDRGARRQAALAGVTVGMMHAFNIETRRLPAFALDVDVLAPVGGLAPAKPRTSLKGIATRTFRQGRLHLNAEYAFSAGRRCATQNDPEPACGLFGGVLPPVVPPEIDDPGLPCARVAAAEGVRAACAGATSASRSGTTALTVATTQQQQAPRRLPGYRRWMVGLGGDRALPLRSLLVAADIFAEWTPWGNAPVDWVAESGVRYQLSPRTVLDVGVGSHFRGRGGSWFITFGAAYAFALRPLMRDGS